MKGWVFMFMISEAEINIFENQIKKMWFTIVDSCMQSHTTQNVATSTAEVFIILNNNCSLPLGSDCCHQNGKMPFNNQSAQTLKSKLTFPILN